MAIVAETTELVRDLLAQYGLVALFGVFVLEGAMLLYFAPSESLVPAAVWLARDALSGARFAGALAAILAVSVVGATIGQYALFYVAKRQGREYVLDNRWIRIGEDRLARFEGWFERWGPVVVPVTNALPFTRGMLTIPAGFAEMDDRRFVVLSALGTLVFETALAAIALGALGVV